MNGKRGDAAAVVIRNENVITGFVEREMARSRAARRDLIQELECAGFRIDSEGADGAARASIEIGDFIHRVEIFSIGVHRQKRRVHRFCRDAEGRELSVLCVKSYA